MTISAEDLDACAVPTPEQIGAMKTGYGTIFTSYQAFKLGMETAIGNVKRALAAQNKPSIMDIDSDVAD